MLPIGTRGGLGLPTLPLGIDSAIGSSLSARLALTATTVPGAAFAPSMRTILQALPGGTLGLPTLPFLGIDSIISLSLSAVLVETAAYVQERAAFAASRLMELPSARIGTLGLPTLPFWGLMVQIGPSLSALSATNAAVPLAAAFAPSLRTLLRALPGGTLGLPSLANHLLRL